VAQHYRRGGEEISDDTEMGTGAAIVDGQRRRGCVDFEIAAMRRRGGGGEVADSGLAHGGEAAGDTPACGREAVSCGARD
jgi:hypothetical protein